jgi:hypothetical protein
MRRIAVLCALSLASCTFSSVAGVRHFTYLYETPTSPPGGFEIENSVTWLHTTNPTHTDELAFRHEIEFGLTDRLQASVYFADWSYSHSHSDSNESFSDAAVELIYNLSNPVLDPVGVSLYQEYRGGNRLFEWESKLIAQKNIDRWILAYTATLEATWEGKGLNEHEGEFQQALGASYQISPRLSIGLEFLHEFVFVDWEDADNIRNVFVGPNVCYRRNNWFVTVTALAQATDSADEARLQVRTIFGMAF